MVPAEAAWAGGVDGGAWIVCGYTTKEPFTGYDCTIFNHPSGTVWAEGSFALVRPSASGGLPEVPAGPFAGGPLKTFSAYDGESIHLANGSLLVPHLLVSYPHDANHGLRVEYRFGQRLRETPY